MGDGKDVLHRYQQWSSFVSAPLVLDALARYVAKKTGPKSGADRGSTKSWNKCHKDA